MNIVVFTSSDHMYANLLMKDLIRKGVFSKHSLFVYEQDSIIPKKSKLAGLTIYLNKSGIKYIFYQILKIYIYKILQIKALLTNKSNSIYFPYYKNNLKRFKREILNNIKSPQSIKKVMKNRPDIILSILSKEIIPNSILEIPKYGCVNIHPAFLPFYRGVSPTFWALANSEEFTGVTLHYIDTKIDTGRIIAQRKFSLQNYKTEHSVYLKCMSEGVEIISEFLTKITNNAQIKTKYNPKKGSYYSLPTKDAVDLFFKNGYQFFTLNEFLKST